MEAEMAQGKKLEDVADQCSRTADTDGITGFMYGTAVSILASCWAHGEALRTWHNTVHGKPDAKGIVNPAILVVGDTTEET